MCANSTPKEDPVTKALELGSNLFKSEKFGDARKIFETAIRLVRCYDQSTIRKCRETVGLPTVSYRSDGKLYHPKYIKLLDNLAACWDKVGETKRAVKIANKMLTAEPYTLKGYIRLARLYHKLGQIQYAYGTYKKALFIVEEGHKKYNIGFSRNTLNFIQEQVQLFKYKLTIQDEKTQTETKRSSNLSNDRKVIDPIDEQERLNKRRRVDSNVPAITKQESFYKTETRSMDLLLIFPQEICSKIFEQLTTKEVLKCSLVSKSWFTFITFNPSFFKDINLNPIRIRHLNSFIKFSSKLKSYQDAKRVWGKSTLVLDSFKLASATPSDDIKILTGMNTLSSIFSSKKILLNFPNMSTTHLHKCLKKNTAFTKDVTDLSIVTPLRIDRQDELLMLLPFSKLKSLKLIFNKGVESIDSTGLQNISEYPILPDNWGSELESLVICYNVKKMPNDSLSKRILNQNLVSLSKICIAGTKFPNEPNQFTWLKNCSSLKEIWFENNEDAWLRHFMHFLAHFPIFHCLKKITFREHKFDRLMCLDHPITPLFNGQDEGEEATIRRNNLIDNLRNINHIDFMHSSLTQQTLLALQLPINDMEYVNLGDCPMLLNNMGQFRSLKLSNLLTQVFGSIKHLILPNSVYIDDTVLTSLSQTIGWALKLETLDISFNTAISGVGLYSLMKELYATRSPNPLNHLILNNCTNISHETINSLKVSSFVGRLDCDYDIPNWKKFGINSFDYKI